MKKPENIYVSLHLEKDEISGELLLNIQFDKNAPNFSTDKNMISWCPSIEELDFVSEAFEMLAKGKHHKQERSKESQHQESLTKEELIHQADEKAILDRVLEKKDRAFIKT
jgi:hypothetical protein